MPKIEHWTEEERGPYLYCINEGIKVLSVFDDLRYDRSDIDAISPAMRMHALKQLKKIGFTQKSGSVFENSETDQRCIIPKSHALGASPFHITDYTKKRDQDYYLLTPTQSACQLIRSFPVEEAMERVKALIQHQPINILRLSDYLQSGGHNNDFLQTIGHLKFVQRQVLENKLNKIRPLSLTRH